MKEGETREMGEQLELYPECDSWSGGFEYRHNRTGLCKYHLATVGRRVNSVLSHFAGGRGQREETGPRGQVQSPTCLTSCEPWRPASPSTPCSAAALAEHLTHPKAAFKRTPEGGCQPSFSLSFNNITNPRVHSPRCRKWPGSHWTR